MKVLTYSLNIFIPVTDLCQNRCGYCSFRREPNDARLISRSEVLHLLTRAANEGCSEALFSLGESPWRVSGFQKLLTKEGQSNLIDYLVELSELALEHGMLPHTNAGLLQEEDLRRLQPYNASMGLMLESTARLRAHADSPGKRPDLRLDYIANAGRLHIPFTTGILVGIGETWNDRKVSLQALADLHRIYGHIQEVIIQPLDPKPGTAFANVPRPTLNDLCHVVEMAREILPIDVSIQVPPNLADPRPLVEAGANDLGGISPVTIDWINPERPWPDLIELQLRLTGYDLRERLCVYPGFIRRSWYGRKTRLLVEALASEDGLRRKSISPRDGGE
jgi:7,8-didemethyl-8-hydroxy-5-deazariboflavin synthase